jgi:hypothetical integral membrane protein (TIGR02206 family)
VYPIFTSDQTATPFELFGPAHLWTILAIGVAGFWIVRAGKAGDARARRKLRIGMIAVFLFWQLEWHIWHLLTESWQVERQLPLHLCGIMILVTVYGLATQDRRVYPFIYFFGIAGSIQAVLTPDTLLDFPHARFLNTMISHGLLVVAGFWIVFVEGFRPTRKDAVVSLFVLNVYALGVLFVNLAIGANYLFITAKPETASVLDFFPEWPWYVLILEALAVVIVSGMCWPFVRRTGVGVG